MRLCCFYFAAISLTLHAALLLTIELFTIFMPRVVRVEEILMLLVMPKFRLLNFELRHVREKAMVYGLNTLWHDFYDTSQVFILMPCHLMSFPSFDIDTRKCRDALYRVSRPLGRSLPKIKRASISGISLFML